MVPSVARVRGHSLDAPEVWTLEIEASGASIAPGTPGQFNMLTAFGIGEIPVSLSGDPADTGRLIHTVRAVGAVSSALAALAEDAPLGVRGPFGRGWPLDEALGRDLLLVAGGLGLAPMRPVIYRILAERARYGRISLLYGTRTPGDVLFRHQLESWRRDGHLDIDVTVDHASAGWHGYVGVVTSLIERRRLERARTLAFVCGPEVMMRFAAAALGAAGIAESSIYLSMERNMKCAVGLCGHCQLGGALICRDGPVLPYARLRPLLCIREL
ncbi:oxidoreductase FAD/NAD(P)-binding subunit [mine drainage metagenome]|jgi:NAD(P)H-flavin reductase|uniref:Oxidoreductase FAD/NAD(P)-binding subunit n=1 Tax=mine drainage metagenome TaxID=410659 RepID=T0ZIE2_9ZZZZ